MSIETIKLKNGSVSFRAVVRIGRKKMSRAFPKKLDAKQWEAEMKTVRRNPTAFPGFIRAEASITLSALMDRFEKEHSEVRNAPATRIMNRNLFEKYLSAAFGSTRLDRLNTQSFNTYFARLRDEDGVSNGRLNRIRQLLHVMFNRAVRWGILPTNPIGFVERLPGRDYSAPDEIRFLSKGELDGLNVWLQTNDSWLYPKVVILAHTGIRYGEMVALRVQDARLAAASPHLIVSRSRCRHTGGFVLPKGKRARTIPLSDSLVRFLRPFVEGRKAEEPLLWTDWSESRWTTKSSKHFRKALEEAKVSRIKIHDLRHTYAVRFLENGGHIYSLKAILGHQDIKLTMRYSHFSPAMAEQARGIVDFERPTPQLAVVDGGLR